MEGSGPAVETSSARMFLAPARWAIASNRATPRAAGGKTPVASTFAIVVWNESFARGLIVLAFQSQELPMLPPGYR